MSHAHAPNCRFVELKQQDDADFGRPYTEKLQLFMKALKENRLRKNAHVRPLEQHYAVHVCGDNDTDWDCISKFETVAKVEDTHCPYK